MQRQRLLPNLHKYGSSLIYFRTKSTGSLSYRFFSNHSNHSRVSQLREQKLLHRDHVIRCHIGDIRISAVRATDTLKEAINRWRLDSKDALVWGPLMAGSVMLSSLLTGEERVKAIMRTNEIQQAYVEAIHVGEVRGFIKRFKEPVMPKNSQGILQVSRILYGSTSSYDSLIQLPKSGCMEEMWQSYFNSSEQIKSIIKLETEINEDGVFCGGLLLQKMPRGKENYWENISSSSPTLSLSSAFRERGIINYINTIIPNSNLAIDDCKVIPLDYFCRCSKENFIKIMSMSHESVEQNDWKPVERITCEMCNTNYDITRQEIEECIDQNHK